MKLFDDKTRWQHFGWAIPVGALLTILCVLGVASALEFKDYQWGGKADWRDWLCTMLGGAVGQAIQMGVLYFLGVWHL